MVESILSHYSFSKKEHYLLSYNPSFRTPLYLTNPIAPSSPGNFSFS
jgi:hypothetical protein